LRIRRKGPIFAIIALELTASTGERKEENDA
jgi:hypothetical protein